MYEVKRHSNERHTHTQTHTHARGALGYVCTQISCTPYRLNLIPGERAIRICVKHVESSSKFFERYQSICVCVWHLKSRSVLIVSSPFSSRFRGKLTSVHFYRHLDRAF
jgi:hypothetical protein